MITPDSWRVVGDGFVMNGESPSFRYIAYVRHSTFRPDEEEVNFGSLLLPEEMVIEPFSEADAGLIADGPLLLAELKRCYERIDELESSEEE